MLDFVCGRSYKKFFSPLLVSTMWQDFADLGHIGFSLNTDFGSFLFNKNWTGK